MFFTRKQSAKGTYPVHRGHYTVVSHLYSNGKLTPTHGTVYGSGGTSFPLAIADKPYEAESLSRVAIFMMLLGRKNSYTDLQLHKKWSRASWHSFPVYSWLVGTMFFLWS